MKTLIFPTEFANNKGGVPQSIISIVRGVAAHTDYRVVVVCPNGSEMSFTKFPKKTIVLKTKRSGWVMSRYNVFGTLATVFDIFKTIRQYLNINTWLVTNQPVTSALISLMPCRHINEVYINRGGSLRESGIATFILRTKIHFQLIDYAIGISRNQRNVLINCGQPEKMTFLIHNGLPLPNKKYQIQSLNPNKLRISTIGYISNLKNQMEGVRLIKLLRDSGINAYFNMYGIPDNDVEYQNNLKNCILELGVSDYVNYCGFVKGEELFEETDILISFSRSEGFGRSIVEGMLRYKPVIAWRGANGPVDIMDDGRVGHLVDCNDANDYYSVINNMLVNPSYNEENVRDSFDFACTNFTEEYMVKNYINFFNMICA